MAKDVARICVFCAWLRISGQRHLEEKVVPRRGRGGEMTGDLFSVDVRVCVCACVARL